MEERPYTKDVIIIMFKWLCYNYYVKNLPCSQSYSSVAGLWHPHSTSSLAKALPTFTGSEKTVAWLRQRAWVTVGVSFWNKRKEKNSNKRCDFKIWIDLIFQHCSNLSYFLFYSIFLAGSLLTKRNVWNLTYGLSYLNNSRHCYYIQFYCSVRD